MLPLKTPQSFEKMVKHLSTKESFSIETRGFRRVINLAGQRIASYRPGTPSKDLHTKEARRLMGQVRASVTRYIKKKNFVVPAIKKEYPVVFTNRLFWESIPDNTEFYIIDAKHAYWRIAFLQGYINEKLYLKYADNKEFKTVRNISLAILNSTIKKEYYSYGDKICEVVCDTGLYHQVYDNIRYFSYNLCGEIRNKLDDSCFAYRTDGVFILKPGLARAKKMFEDAGLFYKIDKCAKIDAKNYADNNGELKKFT